MSTLVYHVGALGDFLTVLPAISRWRAAHEGERLVLLGRPVPGTLGLEYGFFDELWDVTVPAFSPLFTPGLSGEIAKKFSDFGTAVLFCSPDSPIVANISTIVPRVLHQPPFPIECRHITDYHLDMVRSAFPGVPWEMPSPLLQTRCRPGESVGGRPVALHPGSGSRIKNWPINRFVRLAQELDRKKVPVIWILGPAEENLTLPPGSIEIRNVPLSRLAGVLAGCRLSVGNDSGTMHLAATVNTPCICLFGPSDPLVWRPLGETVRVIASPPPCAPCHRVHLPNRFCAGECMETISVDRVIGEMEDLGC